MNGYQPSGLRAVFGLMAVVMAATTLGVLVVLPAQVEAVDSQPYVVTTAAIAQHNASSTQCNLNREEGS
jgi:hypothetical protein